MTSSSHRHAVICVQMISSSLEKCLHKRLLSTYNNIDSESEISWVFLLGNSQVMMTCSDLVLSN